MHTSKTNTSPTNLHYNLSFQIKENYIYMQKVIHKAKGEEANGPDPKIEISYCVFVF